MSLQLVDKDGEIFADDALHLHRCYRARGDGQTFAMSLVRGAGFISVEETTGWYVVRAEPARLTALACMAAGQLLHEDSWRVRLSWFNGKWNDEIHDSRTSAVKRMLLLAQKEHRYGKNRFLSVELTFGQTTLPKRHQVLLDFWRERSASIDLFRDDDALHRLTNGKFVVAEADAQTTEIVFSTIGRGIDVYREPNWRSISTGYAVEQQPDLGYGRWVANGYSEAMRGSAPRLTGVDATILNSKSGEHRRMQYQRLMLPVLHPDGRSALLCASAEDLSLDLRVEIH
ncbi:MAG: hypothetical protein ACR2OV_05560 [Hyphomicrobiaceae bacterium]